LTTTLLRYVCWLRTLGLFWAFAADAPGTHNPATSATFEQARAGMPMVEQYLFGTNESRTVRNLRQLAAQFNPYGISGTTVINYEWERYQTFNDANFRFTKNSLDLTATIPTAGGLFPGGIHSGQIWSSHTYKPGGTGHTIYAFEVRMKIPAGQGMWPAVWLFTQDPEKADTSEIDNPEFFNMKWQNRFDWTGGQHGPGVGAEIYSIKTNEWVWHPGFDFSADYHDYQTFWTPDAVYKYVDGKLIFAQAFRWTAEGAAQLGVNLAVGSSGKNLPGLQPTSLDEFPSALSIDHITIWAK
jgi:Glycosyl hydrolases family 16